MLLVSNNTRSDPINYPQSHHLEATTVTMLALFLPVIFLQSLFFSQIKVNYVYSLSPTVPFTLHHEPKIFLSTLDNFDPSFLGFLKFIYLFLAVLGLHCCTQAFSSCGECRLLLVVVCRLLIAMASLVAEHGLQARRLQYLWCASFSSCGSRALECRPSSCGMRAQQLWVAGSRAQAQQLWCVGFSSCGMRALECRLSSWSTWAQLLRGMWDLPGPGLEPMSPALAGGFSTTAPHREAPSTLVLQ